MGFFDTITSVVSAVGSFAKKSPILETIGNLAGKVAHVIPVVGPMIDAAVPALDAIFSHDAAPPAGGKGALEQQALIQFEDLKKENNTKLDSILDELKLSSQAIDKRLRDLARDLGEDIAKLQEDFHHSRYIDLLGTINGCVQYFSDERDTFRVTPASSDAEFDLIFDDKGGSKPLPAQRETLKESMSRAEAIIGDETKTPSQEMVELYMYALHWLLLFDKAIIICRGTVAKSKFLRQLYKDYLGATTSMWHDITQSINDAKHGVEVLQKLLGRLTADARVAKISVQFTGEGNKSYKIKDSWPPHAIGWISPKETANEYSIKALTDEVSKPENFDESKSPEVAMYKFVARESFHASLIPIKVVIASLTENVQEWYTRLPISPKKNLSRNGAHVKATPLQAKEGDKTSTTVSSKFEGKLVSYTITYVNGPGEGKESESSDNIEIAPGVQSVELEFHPVEFEGDPLEGIPRNKDAKGKHVQPTRGISRRVYLRYNLDNNQDTKELLVELGENVTSWTHNLPPAKKDK